MARSRTKVSRWAPVIHVARVLLVVALLIAIPSPRKQLPDGSQPPTLEEVQSLWPAVARVKAQQDSAGMWAIFDADDKPLGFAARTLPAAKDIVGYRGPTEALILLDRELNFAVVGLLSSSDTDEHVASVVKDEFFTQQFVDWPWGGPEQVDVDAVSGATLTSLAMAEGILKRIGGERPSLVFPDPLKLDEIESWFKGAASIETIGALSTINDADGNAIGRVLRTGVSSDDVVGYQGPTELLLKLADDDTVEKIRLRKSFDNEPYVDYVRVEFGYWAIFQGKTLSQLAEFDPVAEEVEGVSGATMTSLAVADTLVAAAKSTIKSINEEVKTKEPDPIWPQIHWKRSELATIGCLLVLGVVSRLRWHRKTWFRRAWLIAVISVIGLWSGNLISMALVAGWSAEGIAWRLAPGLTAIAMIAVLMPPLTKGNPYCNHLCPHGALQQLIKPTGKSWRRIRVPRHMLPWISRVPGGILVVAYLMLLTVPATDLSGWEPFHAYLFRIAPQAMFIFAGATLIFAAMVPMGFCRFGCPTGSLLDYLRRKATSHRIETGDWVAVALLAIAFILRGTLTG